MTETTETPAPYLTAEEFARERVRVAERRAHELRCAESERRHSRTLSRLATAATTVVLLGVLALVGFIVHQISSEHADEHTIDQLHRPVTVWCYADPNSSRATSSFTGARADVVGVCPDAR